ncbi:Reverse transcriptase (RNA-dependent DNA polymerase) [Popillia japonica]|uniref:Reverse transcriptase (RNA-dependent DNA polymerase) n=1 Tax=Popillia japonica TaxID=7064 RepID=A0AAW1J1W1_POPJA
MRKAPGEDGIYPEMVKSVCLAVSEYVLDMYNGCLEERAFPREMVKSVCLAVSEYVLDMYNGCLEERAFPREWKVAKGVILLKNEEKVRTDPRSYRLITLLAVWGKILERMLVNRLNEKLVDSRSTSQYGIRGGGSTEDAWCKVKECVNGTACKYVLGIFVDFKGALDNGQQRMVRHG